MANVLSRSPIRLGTLAAPARSRAARRAFLAAAAILLALFVGAAVARADIVASDVTFAGTGTIFRGSSTVWNYRINAVTDAGETPATQCNAADGTPAVVTIVVPAAVSVSPATLTFTQCGVFQPVTISSSTVGRYLVFPQVADAGGGVYNIGLATNFLDVVEPPNTPPQVFVTGVVAGATYPAGGVPDAGCDVVDAEDGTRSFPASLSAITGSLSGLGLGSQTASCTYRDRGGLSAGATATYTIVDGVAPVLSLPGDLVAEAVDANGAVVTFAVSAADNVDPAPVVACAPAAGSVFALGVSSVSCTATDAPGNVASGSFTVTVRDTTAPTLSLPGNLVVEASGPDGAAVDFAVSATDLVDPAPVVACTHVSGSIFPLGVTAVDCTATDASGNVVSGGFTVTVEDTTPPVLAGAPADVVAEATGPDGAAVDFAVPTASDLVDGTIEAVCDWAPGAAFPLGSTTVTCTAADGSGNAATATFAVSVRDTTPPVLSLPAAIAVAGDEAGGAVVTFAASATDLVDGPVGVTCTPASGERFTVGQTIVGCEATDAAGNTASGTFVVEVTFVSAEDTTVPTLNLPGDLVADATGPGGAVVTFAVSATDDVDPAPVVTCTSASGSPFPIGVTAVTCTATDAAGNVSAPAGFAVTVLGAVEQLDRLRLLVVAFNIRQGIANSLDVKLERVREALAAAGARDRPNACNQMGAFLHEVAAQRGKALTEAQADVLTAAAERIMAVLSC